MKRKVVLAFAGLVIMLTASFAPVSAPVPGWDIYVTMGGKVDGRLFIYVQNMAPYLRAGFILPFFAPFVTRAPFLSPMHLLENITFSPPIDVDGDGTPDIISIIKEQINPIVHYIFVGPPLRPTVAVWRMTLYSPQAGGGVIFINPAFPCDVDVYTFNNDTGVYWDAPSPLAGTKAAESGGYYDNTTGDFVPSFASRFPGAGLDGIPGTALFEMAAFNFTTDGFGDGIPDPPGSSILMLPLMLLGEEYNATTGLWEPTIAVPMPLVLTTGVAYDHVAQPESYLYSTNSTEEGMPWENLSLGASWDDPKAFIKVVYVCAWSNLLYSLNPDDDGDGIPDPEEGTGLYYTVDMFYEYVEKKVREDVVIADINCDQRVDIDDIVIAALAFGSKDEGVGPDGLPFTADDMLVADPSYDARADLNCDGLIDIFDLVAIAVDFGKIIDP